MERNNFKISLIMATLNRRDSIIRFLESLKAQIYTNFELIIVDQNLDGLINEIINQYKRFFSIKHIKTTIRGLSHARNVGLKHVEGEIIAFPDDDCWYETDTLKKVVTYFSTEVWDVVIGRCIDENKNNLLRRQIEHDCELDSTTLWRCANSVTIFLKADLGEFWFDEKIGAGAGTIYGSGEETDYLLSVMETGKKVFLHRDIIINHPGLSQQLNESDIKKSYLYGNGMGFVLRKHDAAISEILISLIRPFGGAIISTVMLNIMLTRVRWATFCGRLHGWFSYRKED